MNKSKSIVITGASAGIGAALTRALAGDGHTLFVCGRDADRLAEVTKDFASVFYAACNVSSESEVAGFFAQVRERAPSVDVLIHSAGVIGPIGPLIEADSQAWLATIQTNLIGAFLVTKHVVPLMRSERRPRILLLSGGGAFDPMPHLSAYGASKAAITRMAETLAVELAPRNIAVNMLAPGFVETGLFKTLVEAGPIHGGAAYDRMMTQINQWKEEDIEVPINCARFLISEAAVDLTGKTISARFDPWDEPEFIACLRDVVASNLYATQRINLVHLRGERVVELLVQVAKRRRKRHRKSTAPDDE